MDRKPEIPTASRAGGILAALLCAVLLLPAVAAGTAREAAAQAATAAVELTGADGAAARLGIAEIEQLPAVEVAVSFKSEHGEQHGLYKGPLLWTVLEHTGAFGQLNARARLRHAIVVTGRDGYVALLAAGEIDPEFEGKQVVLAYQEDGKPLASGPLRLVVPGDHRGGRSVREVASVAVR